MNKYKYLIQALDTLAGKFVGGEKYSAEKFSAEHFWGTKGKIVVERYWPGKIFADIFSANK